MVMIKVVLVDGTIIEVFSPDRARKKPYGLRFAKHPEEPNKVVISTDPGCVVMVGADLKRDFTTELANLPADIKIE